MSCVELQATIPVLEQLACHARSHQNQFEDHEAQDKCGDRELVDKLHVG
jgi:hypothetical protein